MLGVSLDIYYFKNMLNNLASFVGARGIYYTRRWPLPVL